MNCFLKQKHLRCCLAFLISTFTVFSLAADLKPTCAELLQVVANDVRTRASYESNRNDSTALQDGKQRSPELQETRNRVVAVAKNAALRPQLVRAALADLKSRSKTVTDQIRSRNERNEEVVYDVFGVGMGIHMGIFTNTLELRDSDLKMAVAELSDLVASNFAKGGVFSLNSSNRASKAGQEIKFGQGNLNELINGLIQVPDISARKYPSARALSDAATINQVMNSSDVLFRQRVVEIQDSQLLGVNWPGRYMVTLENQKGESVSLYANVIIDGGGLGKPRVIESIREEYETQKAMANEDPEFEPTITTTEDARERFAKSLTPYREYVGKKVAVIGGGPRSGDSSKVFLELLDRLEAEEYYGKDTAQVGGLRSVLWVGPDLKDCKEYTDNSRVRYDGIAAGLKKFFSGQRNKGEIEPSPGRLVGIQKYEDRWRLVIDQDGERYTKIVDKVVFGTGYESGAEERYTQIVNTDQSGNPLGPENPLNRSDVLERVEADLGKGNTIVAKRLAVPNSNIEQDIYFVGPGFVLADPADTAGVQENRVAIALLGPKTAALADMIDQNYDRSQGSGVPKRRTRQKRFETLTTEPSVVPSIDVAGLDRGEPLVYDDIYLSSKLLVALEQFRFEPKSGYKIRLVRSEDTVSVMGVPELSADSARRIATYIANDIELKQLIVNLTAQNGESEVSLGFDTDEDGEILPNRLMLSFGVPSRLPNGEVEIVN